MIVAGMYSFKAGKVAVETRFAAQLQEVYEAITAVDAVQFQIKSSLEKTMPGRMLTGVSYFEQFVWDLDHRGVADIDIPVLILGVAP